MRFRDLLESLVGYEVDDDYAKVGRDERHPTPPDLFVHEITGRVGDPDDMVLETDFVGPVLKLLYQCEDSAVVVSGQLVTRTNGEKLLQHIFVHSYKDMAQAKRIIEPEYDWSHPDDIDDEYDDDEGW